MSNLARLAGPLVIALAATLLTPSASPARTRTSAGVTARAETPALHDDPAGANADADDPAIWVDPVDRKRSLVLVTAKDAGLRVYDLRAREVQAIAAPAAPGPDDAPGRFNNVDLVTGVVLGGRRVDLAVVTDRGRDKLRFYRIDPEALAAGRPPLVDVTAADAPFAFSAGQAEVNDQATAYGLATYRGPDGAFYAVASRRNTATVGLFRLVPTGARMTYRRVDTLHLPSSFRLPDGTRWAPCAEPGELPQVEGMTVDPATGTLYAAQEDVALWRIRLVGGRFIGAPRQVERVREYGVPWTFDPAEEECVVDYSRDPGFGGRIAADVEGVTILRTGRWTGVLLVSSQGDDTFYAYDRRSNRPIGRFAVVDGPRADGSQECDGAAVTHEPLPGYPNGLLVVHDGHNIPDVPGSDGEPRPNTNVKFVDAGFLTAMGRGPATS